jgi:hypothetical protein
MQCVSPYCDIIQIKPEIIVLKSNLSVPSIGHTVQGSAQYMDGVHSRPLLGDCAGVASPPLATATGRNVSLSSNSNRMVLFRRPQARVSRVTRAPFPMSPQRVWLTHESSPLLVTDCVLRFEGAHLKRWVSAGSWPAVLSLDNRLTSDCQ